MSPKPDTFHDTICRLYPGIFYTCALRKNDAPRNSHTPQTYTPRIITFPEAPAAPGNEEVRPPADPDHLFAHKLTKACQHGMTRRAGMP